MSKRKNGYYWVQRYGFWRIAEWDDGLWYLTGIEDMLSDNDFDNINENQ